MYELRMTYEKSNPMNMVAKLLMNSLYGKFGMKLESTNISIFDTTTAKDKLLFEEMIGLYGESIKDYVKVDNHYLIIKDSIINTKYDQDEEMYHGLDINIAIASAITAGARVSMSILKNKSSFNLYYSDTDSAIIDQALPSDLVGNKLGQFKLEHTIDRGVFLAPKVYGLITEEAKEIIKVKGITFSRREALSELFGFYQS
jgi:DNA polymerase elongation subunit (family B)